MSCIVLGIEIAYAAETAFVSPILLDIGIDHSKMTMIWGLSPVLGFFLSPLMGTMSDRCRLKLGRRRPFIIFFTIGISLGLFLIPQSREIIPLLMGERGDRYEDHSSLVNALVVIFTVCGIILLDFNNDNCLTPARAYLLDNTLPEQQGKALSTFAVMAGIGGTFGFFIGAINWTHWFGTRILGNNENVVFTLVLIIFLITVFISVTSFPEIPLPLMETNELLQPVTTAGLQKYIRKSSVNGTLQLSNGNNNTYGTIDHNCQHNRNGFTDLEQQRRVSLVVVRGLNAEEDEDDSFSFVEYIRNICCMPVPLRKLCLTNFLAWVSHCCFCLYFTDFVGDVVFHGDVSAPVQSASYALYQEGVRFGCYGLAVYALSCTFYSMFIEKLILKFG